MILKESRHPEVGPFYVIDNVVFADTESIDDIIVTPQTKHTDSDNTHYDYWKILQKVYPELRTIDYDYYPRGRVVYSNQEDLYYLYVDKCLQNIKNIRSIIDELNLPTRKVEVREDEHYQCHICNKDYVNIAENYT